MKWSGAVDCSKLNPPPTTAILARTSLPSVLSTLKTSSSPATYPVPPLSITISSIEPAPADSTRAVAALFPSPPLTKQGHLYYNMHHQLIRFLEPQ